MTITVLADGELLDREGRRRLDVAVDDESGIVVATGEALTGDRTLSADGAVVCPGFVDLNVDLRQPGAEAAGTVESGARSGARGGYTALLASADTDPCPDNPAVVAEIRALAKSAPCRIVPTGALTQGRGGASMAQYTGLIDAGVRFFSDAGRPVTDPRVLRNALEYLMSMAEATDTRLVVAQRLHHELGSGGIMHEGEWSSRLGLPGIPAAAEELAVTQQLALARLTGARLHLQQVSTAGAVRLIAEAKADAVAVTAEVSPHHLVLTDADVASFDPNLRLDPPLRTEVDVAALRAAVLDGTIDAVATGHRPHTVDAKELAFDEAPVGALGLETALGLLLGEVGLSLEQALPVLSWQPAAIGGLADSHGGVIAEGRPANLAVVDPGVVWTVERSDFGGYAANSPHLGRRLQGRVRHTVVEGRAVMVDGATP
ncbi:MAG: dihydroorotase [Actinomycetota bacterium]